MEGVAAILKELRVIVGQYRGIRIESPAVITVLFEFSDVQKETVKDAALLAGLCTVCILDEPVALTIVSGLDGLHTASGAVVLDLGSAALSLAGRLTRVCTSTAEYTNATEFVGNVLLPSFINTARLKITLALSLYGVLTVTTDLRRSHSALMEPRHPSDVEIARMQAAAAARAELADVQRRVQTFRTYGAYY
ncbi:hypothetical protein B0H17DRAFT_1215885 [Mycena rosella]|uniref:Uncharacterized protein n=1 Tax=Mycena rosella TaxID=1033263 RepID=A0AAD7CDL3_MYCRO|nr:hypothetical protein B0H17DRAFT_1215885 [Mycena rosella]